MGEKFFFNKYKTAKAYGAQSIEVTRELNDIIKKRVKIKPSDYMPFSSNCAKLTSPHITRILDEFFGKNVSTEMLWHDIRTELYKNVPALKGMEPLASEMGHSADTAMTYVKRD